MPNTRYDVENGEIPPELLDDDTNAPQVPAGRTTADHPGHNNARNAELVDGVRNPPQEEGHTEEPREEKNPPQKEGKADRPRQEANPPSRPASKKTGGLSWWKRNMPWFLGGASQERKKAYFERQRQLTSAGAPRSATEGAGLAASQEVITGVSVADLRQAGFNESTIQHMISVVEAKKQAEAQKMGGMQNLAQYLAQHGETVTLNAQELGISERQISIIKGIADKNNANC